MTRYRIEARGKAGASYPTFNVEASAELETGSTFKAKPGKDLPGAWVVYDVDQDKQTAWCVPWWGEKIVHVDVEFVDDTLD